VSYRLISPLAGPLTDRLLALARADERLLGVTLGGSAARGTTDRYSDLDFVIACRDEDHATLLAELPRVAGRVGPLLVAFTGEHVGEPRLLIALYGPPPLHVDLKLVARRDLAQRVEDGVVLWERGGAVTDAHAQGPAIWPTPDRQFIEDRFWVWIHYAATKIGRGELFECLDLLALLRSSVFGPLIALRAGVRAQGVRRLEQLDPPVVTAVVPRAARRGGRTGPPKGGGRARGPRLPRKRRRRMLHPGGCRRKSLKPHRYAALCTSMQLHGWTPRRQPTCASWRSLCGCLLPRRIDVESPHRGGGFDVPDPPTTVLRQPPRASRRMP
jgi:predicted nucleotidyltransferase